MWPTTAKEYDELNKWRTDDKKKRENVKINGTDAYLICPECGHFPLTLTGEKTLRGFKNAKAHCQNCIFEEDICC